MVVSPGGKQFLVDVKGLWQRAPWLIKPKPETADHWSNTGGGRIATIAFHVTFFRPGCPFFAIFLNDQR
jgi:hypothetical protein